MLTSPSRNLSEPTPQDIEARHSDSDSLITDRPRTAKTIAVLISLALHWYAISWLLGHVISDFETRNWLTSAVWVFLFACPPFNLWRYHLVHCRTLNGVVSENLITGKRDKYGAGVHAKWPYFEWVAEEGNMPMEEFTLDFKEDITTAGSELKLDLQMTLKILITKMDVVYGKKLENVIKQAKATLINMLSETFIIYGGDEARKNVGGIVKWISNKFQENEEDREKPSRIEKPVFDRLDAEFGSGSGEEGEDRINHLMHELERLESELGIDIRRFKVPDIKRDKSVQEALNSKEIDYEIDRSVMRKLGILFEPPSGATEAEKVAAWNKAQTDLAVIRKTEAATYNAARRDAMLIAKIPNVKADHQDRTLRVTGNEAEMKKAARAGLAQLGGDNN